MELTHNTQLESLTSLTLCHIDFSTQSLLNLGDLVPNLSTLNLFSCVKLSSIRELGTSLKQVQKLTLRQCQLKELDGIGMFGKLVELNVPENAIADIHALAMHETISSLGMSTVLSRVCPYQHLRWR